MQDYRKEFEAKPPIIEAQADGQILYPLNATLIRRVRSAAVWPWLLIGVSAFNIYLSFFRAPIRLVLGFTTTELIFEIGHAIGPIATYVALVIVLGMLIVVGICGVYALRYRIWAFWATIAFIGVDTLLFIAIFGVSSVFGVLFRVGAICSLYYGIKPAKIYAGRKLNGQA